MTKMDDSASTADWDPKAPEVRADQRAAYDALRERCPVARDASGTWLLLSHEHVRQAALDDVTFSSAASRFKSVPNSMDGEEHRRFRQVVDRFLDSERIAALVPAFRQIAEEIVAALPRGATIDAVEDIGLPLAVRAQSRWLGWPGALEQALRTWVHDNHEATRSGQLARTSEIAARFDEIVRAQVADRRRPASQRPRGPDVTAELMQALVEDPAVPGGQRVLTEAETVSILRNWTAGDLGSVARAFGVVAHYVATHAGLQAEVRGVRDAMALDRAIDEMLRIDDPFVLNRRVATRDVQIGGRTVPQGARVLLNWTAANRDAAVFDHPDVYGPERNAEHNLVYGIGPHACPGRVLATHELREALSALLRGTSAIHLSSETPATREMPPLGGYARVPVVLT
jgi:cytochrome P450